MSDPETEEKTGTATAEVRYLWSFTCSVCGHQWDETMGRTNDLTAYEPHEGEEIDCPKCEALLEVKMEP